MLGAPPLGNPPSPDGSRLLTRSLTTPRDDNNNSSVLLMCTCVSLAHPRKKFFRGACSGGAFFMAFVTLIAALQFTSLQSLVESMSKQYDTVSTPPTIRSPYPLLDPEGGNGFPLGRARYLAATLPLALLTPSC